MKQLKQWKWNHSISFNHGNFLMPQGYIELSSIARNFRRYFPTLFDDVYDAEQFQFQVRSAPERSERALERSSINIQKLIRLIVLSHSIPILNARVPVLMLFSMNYLVKMHINKSMLYRHPIGPIFCSKLTQIVICGRNRKGN